MRNEKILVIFPGLGSPDVRRYRGVYELLEKGARKFGYREIVNDIRWPGQVGQSPIPEKSQLTLDGALESVRKHSVFQSSGYHIIARSFGCMVALTAVQKGFVDPDVMVLWGPPPYWVFWDVFKRREPDYKDMLSKRGCRLAKGFFESLHPIEDLIQRVGCKTIVATGDKDKYCRTEFLEYLKGTAKRNEHLEFRPPVEGAEHEVTSSADPCVIDEYFNVLFG